MIIHKIYSSIETGFKTIPLCDISISAGFPSPAEDHIDSPLDLNEHLISHPAATFYIYAKGSSMKNVGIFCKKYLSIYYNIWIISNIKL